MKSVPHFLRGAYRGAMRIAMEEATQPDLRRSERLPRMLLHRPGRGGNISKTKLTSRFDDFSAGRWDVLVSASEACDMEQSSTIAVVDRGELNHNSDVHRRNWSIRFGFAQGHVAGIDEH